MPDKEKVGLFLGGLAGGAIGVALIKKHLRDDEDRPVIVVSGGSLKIEHVSTWKKHGSGKKEWESAQGNAKSVAIYAVKISIPGGHSFLYAAHTVEVRFDNGSHTTTFSRHQIGNKHVPLVVSTTDLELTNSDQTLEFKGGTGITEVELELELGPKPDRHRFVLPVVPEEFAIWMF